MNEIRQLCSNSSSSGEHFDEILALFQACPPQHVLSSLSLICQSISCMSMDQLDITMINHSLFITVRQWSERLVQQWLNGGTINGDEYRTLFYMDHLFKLLSEWLNEQDYRTINENDENFIKKVFQNFFLDENFLQIFAQTIERLINEDHGEERSVVAVFVNASHLSDEEDESEQIGPDDVQLETQTSDIQAEQSDVVEVLFRYVNTIVNLFHHPIFVGHNLLEKYVTPCLLNCFSTPLFVQLATEFLRFNLTQEKIPIRSIFILFSSLDFITLAPITCATCQLLTPIGHILMIWNEINLNSASDLSLLIVRFIRLIYKITLFDNEAVIKENICVHLVPHFQILCQTSSITDDLISTFLMISSNPNGKQHLRQLEFLRAVLPETKRVIDLWRLVSLLLTPDDFNEIQLFKRLIHLLTQRTIQIFQSLASASNDTSFDSTTPSSKTQLIHIATQWLIILRTQFLCYSAIADEFLHSTKKNNFLNIFIDTILALEQEEENFPKFIECLIELLWTLSLSPSLIINEQIQKRVDLYRWLKSNITEGKPPIRLASQAILSTLHVDLKRTSQSGDSFGSSNHSNILICMFNADESYSQLCLTLRDRLQVEKQYSVEFVLTTLCQSIDSLVHLIHRSSICLFCVSSKMKSDNLSHFVHRYLSDGSTRCVLLTILAEQECSIDGSWLTTMPMINSHSILRQIRRHFNPMNSEKSRPPSRNSEFSSVITQHESIRSNERTRDFMTCPVSQWSTDDVSQWLETKRGSFDSLQPLMMRLNGPALIHLAEILAIDPVSMFDRLDDELLQRTGSSLPLTEYVSLRSELQRLVSTTNNSTASSTVLMPSNDNSTKKRRWKNSRFCSLF